MARKKKKKGGLLDFFFKKKKKTKRRSKRKESASFMAGLKVVLSIMFLTILVAGGAIGLIYMDRYVKNSARKEAENGLVEMKKGPLNLIGAEAIPWLNQDWLDALVATAGGRRFPLDQTSAEKVATRLAGLSWLKNVQVQTTPEYMEVRADYCRPVGWVRLSRKQRVYLDTDATVLEYIPVTSVPVVEIKGLASTKVPEPGQKWLAADAAAAVELLDLLYRADLHFQQKREGRGSDAGVAMGKKIPEKPLLDEIKSVDVSNFAARKSRSRPNIVLYVNDGTIVRWGAAWGQANIYFEADEKVKLARLYEYFVDHGNTLQGTAKNIELCWLEESIPRPR